MAYLTMSPQVELQQIEDVPYGARVSHYDELEPRAKERFVDLIDYESASVDPEVGEALKQCEIVKFTEYYRIAVC